MKTYLVGGAVRDQLLQLPYEERDWVVTGTTRKDMLDAGFQQVKGHFPVFLHPQTGEEYALARRETKTGSGYQGFEVDCGPDITLEQDLKRRDLTINAMALDEHDQLIDPYQGKEDLDAGLLRHVSPAFVEDPVRLLRIARFAAKLGRWGFRVAHGTHGLMKKMAASDDLLSLRPERIWKEMSRALMEPQPWRFFEVLAACGALPRLLPGLGDIQMNLQALRCAVNTGRGLEVRYGVMMLNNHQDKLPVDKACAGLLELAVRMADEYQQLTAAAAEDLLIFLLQVGKARMVQLLGIYNCFWPDLREPVLNRIAVAEDAMSSVTAKEFLEQGMVGAELGEALYQRRVDAINDALRFYNI